VGPDIISRNLTPDKIGRAEGGNTLAQFKDILRNGHDYDKLHPTCTSATPKPTPDIRALQGRPNRATASGAAVRFQGATQRLSLISGEDAFGWRKRQSDTSVGQAVSPVLPCQLKFMPHMPGLLQRPLGQAGISADFDEPLA